MGLNISKKFHDQLAKAQEFMVQQGELNFQRQSLMQAEMFRKQAAFGVARAQDTALWFGSFTLVVAAMATVVYSKTRNKVLFGALIPTSFVTCYWIDLGYFNKMKRIGSAAEDLLRQHKAVGLPCGAIKLSDIEAIRLGKR